MVVVVIIIFGTLSFLISVGGNNSQNGPFLGGSGQLCPVDRHTHRQTSVATGLIIFALCACDAA